MPLFGLRKNKKNEQTQIQTSAGATKTAVAKTERSAAKPLAIVKAPAPVARQVAMPTGSFSSASAAIIRPHVTEKSGLLSQGGVYTFQVTRDANKNAVAQAIKSLYKVTPVKIAITNLPAKRVFVRGKRGSVPGVKKAIVTVKKGDKIDFV